MQVIFYCLTLLILSIVNLTNNTVCLNATIGNVVVVILFCRSMLVIGEKIYFGMLLEYCTWNYTPVVIILIVARILLAACTNLYTHHYNNTIENNRIIRASAHITFNQIVLSPTLYDIMFHVLIVR